MIKGRRVMEVLKVMGLMTPAVVRGERAEPLLAGGEYGSAKHTNAYVTYCTTIHACRSNKKYQ